MKRPKSLSKSLEDVKYEQYINNLHDRLPSLVDPSDIDCQRWPWELVQNAKDTVVKRAKKEDRFVDVVIKYYHDSEGKKKLDFEHNGDQFTDKAITGLIWKFSAEKRNEQFTEDGISRDKQSTGRFGTGFMTTHALSFTVDISGSLFHSDPEVNRNVSVDFTLHREGPGDEEYKKGVDTTEQEIEDNMDKHPIPEGEYLPTRFTYYINKESNEKAAAMGISNVRANAAQTMLFCPSVRSITVEDEIHNSIFKITRKNNDERKNEVKETVFLEESSDSSDSVSRKFISIEIEEPSEAISSHWKTKGRNLRLHIAVEVDQDNNILPIPSSSPSVYCSLPLIGFEGMSLPFYINSNDFETSSERTSLYLKKKRFEYHENEDTGESEQFYLSSGINWSIFERSLSLYEKVVDYLVDNGYNHRYNLVNGLGNILNGAWDVETKNCLASRFILPLRAMLLTKNLVNTDAGYRSINSNIKFVECSKDRDSVLLYDICKSIYGNDLPIEVENAKWITLIWSKFVFDENCDEKKPDDENKSVPTVGYNAVAKFIEDAESLNNLKLILKDEEMNESVEEEVQQKNIEANKLNWLNKFYSWMSAAKITSLAEKKIVPNRKGDFCSFEQGCALKDAGEIPTSIFDFMKQMAIDWDDHLLMEGVTNIPLIKETTDNVTIAIKERVREVVEEKGDVQKKLLPILLALPALKDEEKPTDFYLKRCKIISILSTMYQIKVDKDNSTTLDLKSETWESADNWFMRSAANTITRRNSLDYITEDMSEDEKSKKYCTSDWLSETLKFMFEKGYLHQEDITCTDGKDSIRIIPNRYGDFKYINQLYTQGSVPDELLNDVINTTGTNIKESLIYKDFELSKKISISEYSVSNVATILNNFFDSEAKEVDKESVANYIIHLAPSSGDLYDDVRKLYDEYIVVTEPITTSIAISDLSIWKGAISFLIKFLADKTSNDDFCKLDFIGKKLLGDNTESIESVQFSRQCANTGLNWINRLSVIVNKEKIQDDNYQLVPDIYGVLHNKSEVIYDGSVLNQYSKYDTLVDIVDGNLWQYFNGKELGDDGFTATIAHPDYIFHKNYQDNTDDKFFGLVDRLINWCSENVAASWKPLLKKSIETLLNFFEENEKNTPGCSSLKLESLFSRTYNKRKELSYDFVFDAETKARIAKINENFSPKELDEIIKSKEIVRKVLSLLAKGKIINLDENNDDETTPIEAIGYDGVHYYIPVNSGLSVEEQIKYVNEAKAAVVKYYEELKQKNNLDLYFDYERIWMNSYSQLNGIYKNGIEIPLVVHSYKGPQYRDFNLNFYDWLQLKRPGSMLWVLTGTELQCIPLYALPIKNINISFVNYLPRETRAALLILASVGGKYCNSINIDYGNNLPYGFRTEKLFNDVPQELEQCIESIKKVCDSYIPQIVGIYNSGQVLQLSSSTVDNSLAFSTKETDTMRDKYEAPPNDNNDPVKGTSFID